MEASQIDAHNELAIVHMALSKCLKNVIEHYQGDLAIDAKRDLGAGEQGTNKNYSSKITIGGDGVEGTFIVSFLQNDIFMILSKAFKCAFDEIEEEEAQEFTSEICNQIFGQFRTHLIALGYQVEMSIPEEVTREEEELLEKSDSKIRNTISFGVDASGGQGAQSGSALKYCLAKI